MIPALLRRRCGLLLLVSAHCATPAAAADDGVDVRAYAVAAPYRLGVPARAGAIAYRLRFGAGVAWFVPDTGEQRVRVRDGRVQVTVCDDCGREAPPDAATLARATQPNAWLESTDPAIRHFARAAGAGSVDTRMRRLVDAVRARLDGAVDYRGYHGARDAWTRRSGDCTEHALLLAAAARARGIPTRVVAGLAYGSRFVDVPNAFGPHMWVQAWDGRRWRSYDSGLAGFDAGHLALALGDGSPASLRGTLQAIASLRIEDAVGLLQPATD